MQNIEWKQTKRDCYIGLVNGNPEFEANIYLAGGWRRAVLYRLPSRSLTKHSNIREAKEYARAAIKTMEGK